MARKLCAVSAIGDHGKDIAIEDGDGKRYLMLFRRGDGIVCYDNVCPHQGRGLNLGPDRFYFTRDGSLMCAHHGARFNLDTGACVAGPCQGTRLRRAPVEVREGEVWLADGPAQ